MKREDLKKQLIEAGTPEDKLNGVIDYVMAQNGADINAHKSELEALKSKYADDIKAKDDLIKGYEEKVKGYGDYEELKKFKADSIANAEKSRKIDFFKKNGCKHPELMIDKVDFSKGTYDETKQTYTGLDDSITDLKKNYADLFDNNSIQKINPSVQPNNVNGEITSRYLTEHPEMAKFMPPLANQK